MQFQENTHHHFTARGRISLIIIPVIEVAQSIFQKLLLCIERTGAELVCFCVQRVLGQEEMQSVESMVWYVLELSLGEGRREERGPRGAEDCTGGELEGVLRMLHEILPR